jgi:transcription elongation factor Elf1
MFELPPFRKCLRCKNESFGTLSVGGNRVTKRCKECRYSHDEVLPEVDKRVIYLDQFAVSELYKTKTKTRKANEAVQSQSDAKSEFAIHFLCFWSPYTNGTVSKTERLWGVTQPRLAK